MIYLGCCLTEQTFESTEVENTQCSLTFIHNIMGETYRFRGYSGWDRQHWNPGNRLTSIVWSGFFFSNEKKGASDSVVLCVCVRVGGYACFLKQTTAGEQHSCKNCQKVYWILQTWLSFVMLVPSQYHKLTQKYIFITQHQIFSSSICIVFISKH